MKERTKDIYVRVKRYIDEYKMITAGDFVVAGVSGGADSVCLLVMLRELQKNIDFRLSAVHVNHGVREAAGQDADYVRQLCDELGVLFFLKEVDMKGYAVENGLSQEEAGRLLRYKAFEEAGRLLCYKAFEDVGVEAAESAAPECTYKIAVAHNNNDRAETLLFNLFRGSGLKGLGSIRPVRENVIRPLLCLDRVEIEEYLLAKGIKFCTDSTNDDDDYTRNRIRHHIIPFAEEQICKNVTEHLAYTADILAETEAFVQKLTKEAYEECAAETDKGLILDLSAFHRNDQYIQKTVLLRCMEQLTPHRKDITNKHIEALLKLTDKDGSKELALPYGLRAYKEYDRLIIRSGVDIAEYPAFSVTVPGEITVAETGVFSFQYLSADEFFSKNGKIIPQKRYTKWFDCDKITRALLLRTRKAGDYLTINGSFQKKSVKEYMINEKIPKMQRERIYLLADGEHVLWIPGYRISQFYKVDENTKRILQVRLKEETNG
ncbi:MAG: tRNA lysidine(34) synthetase TilS [Clostridiales bacterium]|nr:tRNA lysidine(34) synthetase TilS [Clostridiales bacterium]